MIKIAPSILSADFSYLGEQVSAAESGGASYLHLDVMDGHFVPNISFGAVVIEKIRSHSSLVFDAHLMIEKPERYIEMFAKAGADIITVHYEAAGDAKECIGQIKKCGKKAGLAINPATPVEAITDLIDELDLVLVMSVEPGFGGQKYIAATDEKLQKLRAIAGSEFDISVDGGIGLDNLAHVVEMGANVIVAGSAVFGSKDIEGTVREFNRIASYQDLISIGKAGEGCSRYVSSKLNYYARSEKRLVHES